MIACPYCGTTSFLADRARAALAGIGQLHDAPQLVRLGQRVRVEGEEYLPVGHARFSYGRGEWDEYWVESASGEPAWLSVDEGDVVLQRPLPRGNAPMLAGAPALGPPPALDAELRLGSDRYRVTESETARCVGLRGLFGEVLAVDEAYRFVNCTGEDGRLLSGEQGPDGWSWFIGRWVDPFQVRPA